MKRRYALILLTALLFTGCTRKPPAALDGRWDHAEGTGKVKVATRLNLESDGRWRLTRLGAIDTIALGGPVTAEGQILEAGTYTANAKTIRFQVRTIYLGGKDVGSTMGSTVRVKYTLDGNTMTIENKGLPLASNSSDLPDPALGSWPPVDLPEAEVSKERVPVRSSGAPSPPTPSDVSAMRPVRHDPTVALTRASHAAPAQPAAR